MTTVIRLAVVLGIVLTASAVQAKPKNLGDCYNIVIAACNKTAHPIPCANTAMDACDKEFKMVSDPPRRSLGLTAG